MKRLLFRVPALALLFSVVVFAATARQAAPLLPPLSADEAGRLPIRRGELVAADYAVAVAAAAHATKTDPAFLFALAARTKFAAGAYGARAAFDPDAPVGGPYAYGSVHWLKDLTVYGEEAGYPALAEAVTWQPPGTLAITDPDLRFWAMTARTDPYLASFLAAKSWRQMRAEIAARRAPSEGLVMVAFLGGVRLAHELADHYDKTPAAPLEKVAPADHAVLLLMTGLPARDGRTDAAWTIGAFIDEVTSRLRHDTSAYSAARRIDVPDDFHPNMPMI